MLARARTKTSAGRGAIRAAVAAALSVATVACSLGHGTVPVAALSEDVGFGTKMLRPDARARVCGATFGPFARGEGTAMLDRAMRQLLAVDEEADVIVDLEVQWRGVDLFLLQIGCVHVRGDVARMTSSVRLPMLGDHGHHAH